MKSDASSQQASPLPGSSPASSIAGTSLKAKHPLPVGTSTSRPILIPWTLYMVRTDCLVLQETNVRTEPPCQVNAASLTIIPAELECYRPSRGDVCQCRRDCSDTTTKSKSNAWIAHRPRLGPVHGRVSWTADKGGGGKRSVHSSSRPRTSNDHGSEACEVRPTFPSI